MTEENDDIHGMIRAAMDKQAENEPVQEVPAEPVEQEKPARERDETGKFKAKESEVPVEETPDPQETPKELEAPATSTIPAPQSWTPAAKEKWAALPPEIQAEVARREEDLHKAMTRNDGELAMGREMKEVITPYLAQIQSEGGTPARAVQSLLNTAYQLRTATPQGKAALVQEIIKTYGVDMSLAQVHEEHYEDPAYKELREQNQKLMEQANPDYILKEIEKRQENARIENEVKAFASDPANVHYQKVIGTMAAILPSIDKGDLKAELKEAYDRACYADPEIRSTLTQPAAKQEINLEAKKNAGSSLSGSPAANQVRKNALPEYDNVEDTIRAAIKQHGGRI